MDQRVKGGIPPTPNHSTPGPASAPGDSERDQGPEKKRRVEEAESGDVGAKKEEEKRGAAGKKREAGDKGAVLELLIEGRCGGAGQISGKEASCPDGNVRLRIGLQAKRTKKPPKILENYVCKPTIRTYQRHGRGGPPLRGDGGSDGGGGGGGGGGTGQPSKSSGPAPDEATRDRRSALDAVQATSKKTGSAAAAAASPPQASSALTSPASPPQPPSSSSAPAPALASVPAVTSQGTKSAKQVPIKLADKPEVKSNGSSERVKKERLPIVNGQPVAAGHKPCSPTKEQPAPATTHSAPGNQDLSSSETRSEGKTSKKHNGLVQATKQKGLPNGKGSVDIHHGTFASSSKIKVRKRSSSSSVSSVDSSSRLPVPASSREGELSLSNRSRPGSPPSPSPSPSPSVTPKPQPVPAVELSSAQSRDQDEASPHSSPDTKKEKEKERRAKKERKKDRKSKRDKLEAERAKSESRKEEGKKKKKEKGKDGKVRHGKEKDERHKSDDTWRDELQIERDKAEKKKDKPSADREQRTEDGIMKYGETVDNGKLDKSCKVVNTGTPDEIDRADDSCKPAKQAEPATATGDASKSKEQDNSRHSTVPPSLPSNSAPPSLLPPPPSARAPVSPPSSPREQDSRPLKKRKARRPSWTKLVHRAQREESQEARSDSQHNTQLSFPQNPKSSLPAKATIQQPDESHTAPSGSSSPLSSATKPPSLKQSHPSPPASRSPVTPVRKRGRPKSRGSSIDETPPRLSPNAIPAEAPLLGCDGIQKAPVLEPSPTLQCADHSKSSPKKRGRPPKRQLPKDQSDDALNVTDDAERSEDFHTPEKANRQLKIRKLINEMKKRKKRRLHKVMLSGYVGKEGRACEAADGESSLRMCKSIEATTVQTLTALSSSFGSKLGPQINVSKRGTIYMGKRRGRKPKAQTAQNNSQNSTQSSLFTNPSETFLFSNQPQPPSHPFPSPSLTHSSGAQSPYSEGSLTEPSTSLLFPHSFPLPSPSSSCTSPRPPHSSTISPFVKKSCPCQGRHHFPFHQSSCKLSCPTPPLHHTPGSPGHLKEATVSPRSESHSEETLPSDSGIGTDNNSVSERGDLRGVRGVLRLGQGSGVLLGGQRHPSSLADHHHSPVSSPLSHVPRTTNPAANSATAERHRDRHRHRRRDYDCSPSCTCLCPCPCPGHNKCTASDYYTCLGHNALKRQKNKHKKKHQQLHMQDPEFLAELEDLIGQFSEVHIGRRNWARTGLGKGFDGSGSAGGGRRHPSSSSHSLRSNIFRINLNGFYSPHPSPYPANPSFSHQPFYPCQPVHCNRKPERRQCGCPSKFQETIENMGYYSSYPPATTLYHHLPSSYQLSSPHQYAPHQPHHAHFLLNPARFHRRRSRFLREGALGGEVEGDVGGGGGGGGGGGPHLSSGFTSSLSCGCGRGEHKHKHKHRHRHCSERDLDEEEELHDDEEEDGTEREGGSAGSKPRSGFIFGQAEGGRKGSRGMGGMLSKESPWTSKNGNNSFSFAAAKPSSSSAERFKHTSVTSLGMGSSHLSSFGGGWGGLSQSWMKFGGLGAGTGFGNPNPSWRGFTGEQQQHAGRPIASDGEDEDGEDIPDSRQYRKPSSPTTYTNLFTTMARGTSRLRSGVAGRGPGSGDRSWRMDEPAWTERREAGLQGDSRGRGQQQKSMPTPDGMVAGQQSKRRPGRPRKHPLPSAAAPSPMPSSAASSMSSPDLLPGHCHNRESREVGGRREGRGPERDHRGGSTVPPEVTELEHQARRRKAKRKHGDSPCHQSVTEDNTECGSPTECFSQSEVDQAPSQPVTIQREEREDVLPRKAFLRAGLYSDDYKTTDPPFRAQQSCRESMEHAPEEREYSLLPAPIHVGKYLRLKRINFQLPYDVMWLWQNDQLPKQPAVPLKRKRRYCRLKERTGSSQQTAEESSSDITSLFPHLDMEPLTSGERSFVVKQHVFLVRNWELVRDRQIRLRIERERRRDAEGEEEEEEEEREERESPRPACDDGTSGDDGHIKSDQLVEEEVTDTSSDPRHQGRDTSGSLTASPRPTKTQSRREEEEEEEEEKRGEEEVCSREQRRKRLNDLLLTLQH